MSNTVVRENGSKTSQSALAVGEPVWVGGPVLSGVKDARLVVIRPPSGAIRLVQPVTRGLQQPCLWKLSVRATAVRALSVRTLATRSLAIRSPAGDRPAPAGPACGSR